MSGKKRINLNLQRQIIAEQCTETWTSGAYTSSIFIPDVTDLLRMFEEINPPKDDPGHLSLNILFMKLIAEGIKAAPKFNAQVSFHQRRALGKITLIPKIDFTVALWTEFDTLVPRFPDFGSRSMTDMASYMTDFKRKLANTDIEKVLKSLRIWHTLHQFKRHPFLAIARIFGTFDQRYKHKSKQDTATNSDSQKDILTIDDFKPGTFLITNPGSLTPNSRMLPSLFEIIPHTTAGVAIGPIYEQPVIINGELVARKFLPLCIVANHCAIDYGDEVPFINRIEEICKSPEIIKSWM